MTAAVAAVALVAGSWAAICWAETRGRFAPNVIEAILATPLPDEESV